MAKIKAARNAKPAGPAPPSQGFGCLILLIAGLAGLLLLFYFGLKAS